MVRYSSISLLLSLTCVVVRSDDEKTGVDLSECLIVEEKVFKSGNKSLEPSQTLDLLKVLNEQCKTHLHGEATRKRKEVIACLDVGRVGRERCENLYELYKKAFYLLKIEEKSPNLTSFLNHYKEEQFSLCHDYLLNKLKKAIEELPQELVEKLELLKEKVSQINGNSKDRLNNLSIRQDLGKATLLYLKDIDGLNLEQLAHSLDAREAFSKIFDSQIKIPCIKTMATLYTALKEYQLVTVEEEKLDQLVPAVAQNWLQNYNVCSSIVSSEWYTNAVMERGYNLLIGQHNKSGIINKARINWNACFSISRCKE